MERLDKYLCDSGIGTRTQVKQLLKSGRVTVNGKPEKDPGKKIDPQLDTVCFDGEPLGGARRVVLMLHKSAGFVTATEDKEQRTVMELLPAEYKHLDLKPVGRLDKETEGLLLFTNDGDFANRLMHPKQEVKKVYDVWVTGFHPGADAKLRGPIELDGYMIRRPEVKLLRAEGTKARLQVTIHEGRNRQVRRMCEAAGLSVTRLRRIREGNVSLGDLPAGKWRYLTPEEVISLH